MKQSAKKSVVNAALFLTGYCSIIEIVFDIDIGEALDTLFEEVIPNFLNNPGDVLEDIGNFLLDSLG